MNYTNNNLDMEALKRDESAFRELVGNIPEGYGKNFQPNCLTGDSWTFFKSEEGFYLLQRKSTNEVLDIGRYAKEVGLSIEELKVKFPRYVVSKNSNEIFQSWLSLHGLTEAEIKEKGWIVSETEIKYPIQTEDGIKYQTRKLGAEHKERFYSDKGLKTSQYFYTPSELKGSKKLIICAGASDSLNAYLAFEGKVDCVGVLGEGIIPKKLLEVKYDEFVIAYDSDEAGKKGAINLTSKLKNSNVVNWSLFANIKDLSELAAKQGREAIISLINSAVNQTIEPSIIIPKSDGLPDPLPLIPSVIPFDVERFLPNSSRDYVQDIAERIQCPVDFPALSLITVFSAAIGGRVGICPKAYDNWLSVPNLWGFIVGRPSLMKSPAVKCPISLLEPLEKKALLEYKMQMKEFRAEERILLAEQKEADTQVKKLLKQKPVDQEEIKKLQKTFETEIEEPKCKRYIVNDTSMEKLGEILAHNPHGVLLFRDELNGFLKSLEKENQETSRTFYLEAWNGDSSYIFDRIGRGTIHIENICVSIFGTIQPDVLQNIVRKNISQSNEFDGFLQRFQLIAYPDISNHWENIDREAHISVKNKVQKIVQSLVNISSETITAEVDSRKRPYLRFDPEAQELFNEWRRKLEYRLREGKEHPALESHLAKYRSLIPNLALIFHLSELSNHKIGRVGICSLQRAIALGEYLESHARRIYSLGEENDLKAAKVLLGKLKMKENQNAFSARDIYRKNWKGLNSQDVVQRAINQLVEKQILLIQTKENSQQILYSINPKILVEETG